MKVILGHKLCQIVYRIRRMKSGCFLPLIIIDHYGRLELPLSYFFLFRGEKNMTMEVPANHNDQLQSLSGNYWITDK